MEALEVLKNLVGKFKAIKAEGVDYKTYRDRDLSEAFKEADAFLNPNSESHTEEEAEETSESTEDKPKKTKKK